MTILVRELRAEIEVFKEGCRKLAFQLGAGGYNADEITAGQLIAKIQDGLNLFCDSTSGWVQKLEAERDQLKAENAELRRGQSALEAIATMPADQIRDTYNWAYYAPREIGSDAEQIRAGMTAVLRKAMTKEQP